MVISFDQPVVKSRLDWTFFKGGNFFGGEWGRLYYFF